MPTLELTSAERGQLKSLAHHLKPLVQLGSKGLTEAVLKEINTHLLAHQLIKVKIGGEDRDERLEMVSEICERLSCAQVQLLGKTLVLYRPEDSENPLPEQSSAADFSDPTDQPFIPKKKAAHLAQSARPAAARPLRRAQQSDAGGDRRTHGIPRRGSALSLKSRRKALKKSKA